MLTIIRRGMALAALLLTCQAGAGTPEPEVGSALEWRLVGPFRAGWATAAARCG